MSIEDYSEASVCGSTSRRLGGIAGHSPVIKSEWTVGYDPDLQ
jgi:hypothetical protein